MALKQPKIVIHNIGSFMEIAYKELSGIDHICSNAITRFEKLQGAMEQSDEHLPEWYLPYCKDTLNLLLAISGRKFGTTLKHQHLLLALYDIGGIHEELDQHSDGEITLIMNDIRNYIAKSIDFMTEVVTS